MSSSAIAKSNKDIDPQLLLGYLAFYSLGDIKITEADLESLFVSNKLDTKYIRKIAKADAFRRASSSVKRTLEISYNGAMVKAMIEVNELRSDATGIVKLMGRKLVDEKNETLDYAVIGRMEFERATNQMTVIPNVNFGGEYPYDKILEDALNNYKDWTVYHTKDTVRNLVNNVVKTFQPIGLMSSGLCKFLPKTYKDDMFALRSLVKDLSGFSQSDPNEFELIPVIDTDEQRDLISKSANDDMKNELNSFVAELTDVIKNKQVIPKRTATTYANKFRELQNKATEYESLVGTYMTILKQQITQAMEFVEDNAEEEDASK